MGGFHWALGVCEMNNPTCPVSWPGFEPGQEYLETMSTNGMLFMVSLGFNAAASVRVSNELGAGNPKSAAFSVVVVNTVSFIVSVLVAAIVLWQRLNISYIFTDGTTVSNTVSKLCSFLAVTLILNGIQPVLSGNMVRNDWRNDDANHHIALHDISN
ncbi:unnamed protein product [Fraxinus pennsylvanica]|uniref:Uncharacterized protein n=1 Tax=Fraxinus pennsylvanica TaxID=56036 RepID=A0AAD2DHU9_9LAMI|nr:unnamed protein product [Fraxinus pennsylvanica]